MSTFGLMGTFLVVSKVCVHVKHSEFSGSGSNWVWVWVSMARGGVSVTVLTEIHVQTHVCSVCNQLMTHLS